MRKKKKYKKFVQLKKEKKNPYFKTKKKKQSRNKKKLENVLNIFLYFLIFVWSLTLIYIFFISSFLKINNIIFDCDCKYIDKYKLEKYAYNLLDEDNNILFFSKQKFLENLLKYNNFIDSIDLRYLNKNKILLKIKEKNFSVLWRIRHKIYAVDNDANVIDKLDKHNISLFVNQEYRDDNAYYGSIIFHLLNNKILIDDINLELYKKSEKLDLSLEKFHKILLSDEYFKTKKIKVSNYSFLDHLYDNLVVNTYNGVLIYFSLNNDFEKEVKKLDIFFRNLKDLDNKLSKLKYIDLRIDGKIFYK